MEALLTTVAVLLRILANPLGNTFQKQLTARGNQPLVVSFLTYFFLALTCCLLILTLPHPHLSGSFWLYAMLGGIAGALGNGFLVKALHQGDLSVLGPINAYKSVVGIIAGIFLLNEIPNIWGLVGIALIIYGSYFVLDSTAERVTVALLKKPAIQYRLLAMILTAVEAVFVKKVIIASSTTLAFISWCCFGAFFSFVLLLLYRIDGIEALKSIRYADARKYLFLIVCIGIMQFTTNYVFERIPVGYALSLFQLSTMISVLLGHRIFNEQGIQRKMIGTIIMIIGSVMIILLKD